MNLPFYNYDCARIELGPDDFPPPIVPGGGMTFDKLYRMYVGPVFAFVEPIFNAQGETSKLVFSKIPCTDCTQNGSLTKPDFWIDLE